MRCLAILILLVPLVALADVRNDKRTELMAKETLRMVKRAETQTPLNGRDFAKAYRRVVATVIPELCACRDRYRLERKMRAHCAMDAFVEMILDLMPVVLRQPGVLKDFKAAMAEGEAASGAYGEKVVADLMEETLPAKERLRIMKQMAECIGDLGD